MSKWRDLHEDSIIYPQCATWKANVKYFGRKNLKGEQLFLEK